MKPCGRASTAGRSIPSVRITVPSPWRKKPWAPMIFSKIPNGAPGVQHRAQLLYTYGVCAGRLSLEQMAALLSSNAAHLFGMPDRIFASLDYGKYNDFQVEDGADIQLEYAGGLHGTFISASGENPGVNRLEVWGTKGCLCVEDAARVYLDENDMDVQEFGQVNEEIYGILGAS